MARRKRTSTRKTTGVRQAGLKQAGIAAHNIRLGSAVSRRNMSGRTMQSFNEARIGRVRRKARVANPRTAALRQRGRELSAGSTTMLRAIPSKLSKRSFSTRTNIRAGRVYKRDRRGRFAR